MWKLIIIISLLVIVILSIAMKFKNHETVTLFAGFLLIIFVVFIYDDFVDISDKKYLDDKTNYTPHEIICNGETIVEDLCFSHGCYYRADGKGYYELPNEYHPTLVYVKNGNRIHFTDFTITQVGGEKE